MTSWTREALTHETMVRQGLSSRRPVGVADAVRSVLALQAQEPAAPYLALWNRIEGFDPSDLDRALADGAIVKASLFRFTLHAVDATTSHGRGPPCRVACATPDTTTSSTTSGSLRNGSTSSSSGCRR